MSTLSFCWMISCYYWLLFLSWRDLCSFQSNVLDLTFIFRKEKNHLFPEMSYWFVSSLCTWSLSATFEFYMIWFNFHIVLLCCWSTYFQYGNPLYYHNFNISQLSRFRCDGLINKIRYQQRRKEPAKQSRISDPSLEVTMASLFSYQITIVVCMIEHIPTSLRSSLSIAIKINIPNPLNLSALSYRMWIMFVS
jgi:hypothetical protein